MATIKRHEVNGEIRYEIIIPEPWFTWFNDKKIATLPIPDSSIGLDQFCEECGMPGVKVYFTNESNTITIRPMAYYYSFGGVYYRSFRCYAMYYGLQNILGEGPYNYSHAERLYHKAYNDTGPIHLFKFSMPRKPKK